MNIRDGSLTRSRRVQDIYATNKHKLGTMHTVISRLARIMVEPDAGPL